MRVLDRYLLRQSLPTLAVSLVVLAFVLVMHRMFLLADLVVARGVPVTTVVRLMGLALPALLPLLLPVSLLVAVLLAAGRLSLDNEAVALRALGVSLAQTLRPFALLSLAVAVGAAGVSLWGQPAAAGAFRRALYDAVKNRVGLTAAAGTFNEVAPGITLYAGESLGGGRELRDLFLVVEKGPRPLWIAARSGRLWSEGERLSLDLRNGEVHDYQGPGTPYRRARFRRYRVDLPLPAEAPELDAEEMTTPALWAAAAGGDRGARFELHRRLSVPVGCLLLGLLGGCLGFHHSRLGKGRGYVLGLGVLVVYYGLLTVAKAMSRGSGVPPELAVWGGTAALGALTAFAYRRKNHERPLPLEEGLEGAWHALRARLGRGGAS